MDERQRAYIESARQRLVTAGFREEPPQDGAVLKARRRQVKLSRFGVVETVVVIGACVTEPDADGLRSFGQEAVRSAAVGKSRLPLGFGSSLVVYPVIVVDGISDALAEFVRHYVPKLWAVVEFPIVVEPSANSLVAATKTPVWGGAYYRKTRREAHDLLAPE